MMVFDDFFSRGSPGNADWEGRKAHSIGIGPVHRGELLRTGERRCVFPPNHGDYSAVVEVGTWDSIKVGAHEREAPMFFRYFNGHLRVTTISRLRSRAVEVTSERQALADRERRQF